MSEPTSPEPKRIALVAHDDKKGDLLEWAEYNRDILAAQHLYATGTTGRLLGSQLDLPVTCFQSGPLGGDQQIGALIAAGRLDMLVFFWDPMSPQPHDRRLPDHLAAARRHGDGNTVLLGISWLARRLIPPFSGHRGNGTSVLDNGKPQPASAEAFARA